MNRGGYQVQEVRVGCIPTVYVFIDSNPPVLITHVLMVRSPLRTTQEIPVTLWLLPGQQKR